MALSGRARALAIGLVLTAGLGVVLTPLGGLETRSISDATTIGLITVVVFLAGLVLNVVAIVLLFRRPRTASMIAFIGLILFFPGILADRTGLFSSQPAPLAIAYLEAVTAILLIAVLFLVSSVFAENRVKSLASP